MNFDTINSTCNEIVKQLKQNRNDSGVTIDVVAEWLKVDRRKIIDLENFNRFDIKLICEYADIYGIEIKIKFIVT
jgi:predicted transcriptional regulator